MAKTLPFIDRYPLEKRRDVAGRLLEKYPDRIPIIVERSRFVRDTPLIDKQKFIVPKDHSFGKFLLEVRKHVVFKERNPDQALFFYVRGEILPPTAANITHIYQRYKNEDGFLYITYAAENTFGGEDIFG